MGCVFEGFDRNLDQRVALKVLRRDLASIVTAERFKREGRILARLKHPNIVSVFDSLETSNRLLVLVMEYVDGKTLQEVLKTRRLSVDEARGFGVQLLRALEHAHDQGVIHRDIKPGNIFIRGSEALLGDFGIAYSDGPETTTLTAEGTNPGTLLYMAPEQFHGVTNPRTDIFSLGLVLRQCFTGTDEKLVRDPAKDAWRGVRRDVKQVVERAVSEDPKRRWQSAARFQAVLKATARSLAARLRPALVTAALVALALLAFRPALPRALPPRVADLAILPFEAKSDVDGPQFSRLVRQDLEWFSVINLIWWDAPPTSRGKTVPGAQYYLEGSISRSAGLLDVDVKVRDSTGRLYESIRATGDTGQVQLLARALADSIICKVFTRDCATFRSIAFRPVPVQAITDFFNGKDSVAKGNWAAGERHFTAALARDPSFMPAAWELMIARRFQRKDYSADLKLIARNLDSLPDFYRHLAIASLTPDLRERMRLFEAEVRDSRQNGTALLMYSNELFHRGALVGRPLDVTVDTLELLAQTEPEMKHASTYDIAWWGNLRLGREREAKLDLRRREALGLPPGDTYKPFQHLGTFARFSPWRADLARWLLLRSPSKKELESLTRFARLGTLMDIPSEQLALGNILSTKGLSVDQRAAGRLGLAAAHLMLGRPGEAMVQFDSGATLLGTPEMQLQQREWPVQLSALGLLHDSAMVERARSWLETAPLAGTERVRALYALGRDAMARGDTARAAKVTDQLLAIAGSPSAARHAALLGAELAAARGHPGSALEMSSVIFVRDTTVVKLSPFARAATYLARGRWQEELGLPDDADREWFWYESADFDGWPTGAPQEGEVDAIVSVYARLLRGELAAGRGNITLACGHLGRVRELWNRTEPVMQGYVARADSAWKVAECH